MKLCVRNPDGAKDWEFKGSETYEVYFNGDNLSRCVAADDIAGEAWIYDADDKGHLKLGSGQFMYEPEIVKLTGKVELVRVD